LKKLFSELKNFTLQFFRQLLQQIF